MMRLQFCILPRTSMNGSPSSTGRYFYHLTRILLVRIFLSAADFVVVLEECKFVGTGKVLSKGERNGISEKCNQLKLPYVVFGLVVSIFLIARMNCPPLVNNICLPHERSSIAMILLRHVKSQDNKVMKVFSSKALEELTNVVW